MDVECEVKVALVNFTPGGKVYPYQFPYNECLRIGDRVLVEDMDDKVGSVVMAESFYKKEELKQFLEICDAAWPLKKILSEIHVVDLKWKEGEGDGEVV
jgi:hypothetical protein